MTWAGFHQGALLRGYMYDFLQLLAPHLTHRLVDRAGNAASPADVDALFADVELPVYDQDRTSTHRSPEGTLAAKPLRELWPYLRHYQAHAGARAGRAADRIRRDAGAAAGVPRRHRQGHGRAGSRDDRFLLRGVPRRPPSSSACSRRCAFTWSPGSASASSPTCAPIFTRASSAWIPTFFEVTRTGEVLSRLTTDTTLVQSIAGVNLSITLRSAIQLVGALVLLIATSPSLAGMILMLHSAGDRAADHRRSPAAHAVARVAGSHRRYQRPRRRNAQRDSDRAGVHARVAAHRALRQSRRGFVRRRDPPHAHARGADGGRHDDGLRRGHVRAVARRASRARGRR